MTNDTELGARQYSCRMGFEHPNMADPVTAATPETAAVLYGEIWFSRKAESVTGYTCHVVDESTGLSWVFELEMYCDPVILARVQQ